MQKSSEFTGNVKWSNINNRDEVVEAIPTNISELLKDDDKNGIPDFADEIVKESWQNGNTKTFNKTYININGKTFDNMADATKYATDNIPALKLLNKLINFGSFINSKTRDVVIDGQILDNKDINKTFDANQEINPDNRNLPKGASKTDLILGLIILALVFVVVLYFIFQ